MRKANVDASTQTADWIVWDKCVVLLVSDRRWMESIIQMYLLSARRSHESELYDSY